MFFCYWNSTEATPSRELTTLYNCYDYFGISYIINCVQCFVRGEGSFYCPDVWTKICRWYFILFRSNLVLQKGSFCSVSRLCVMCSTVVGKLGWSHLAPGSLFWTPIKTCVVSCTWFVVFIFCFARNQSISAPCIKTLFLLVLVISVG